MCQLRKFFFYQKGLASQLLLHISLDRPVASVALYAVVISPWGGLELLFTSGRSGWVSTPDVAKAVGIGAWLVVEVDDFGCGSSQPPLSLSSLLNLLPHLIRGAPHLLDAVLAQDDAEMLPELGLWVPTSWDIRT